MIFFLLFGHFCKKTKTKTKKTSFKIAMSRQVGVGRAGGWADGQASGVIQGLPFG